MNPVYAGSLVVGIAALLAVPAVSGPDQPTSSAPSTSLVPFQQQPSSSKPYRQLFEVPGLETSVKRPAPIATPRVVCGMTIIPADPSVDPKILVAPPREDTRHTPRVIPPPVCK